MNGELKLVNGQHTLAAIIKSGCSQKLTVTISKVYNNLEVAQLYFRHDNHLTRQISDAFRALNLDAETGLNLTQQQWVGSAVMLIGDGLGQKASRGLTSRISRDDLAQGVKNLANTAKMYLNCIAGCRQAIQKVLTRRATMAVALITCFYSPTMSQEFWNQVAIVDGLSKNDPRKKLNEFLLDIGMTGGGLTSKRNATPAYHCRGIAVAWNAYFESRDLKIIKVYEDTPIKILGSPYIGDKVSNELQTSKFLKGLSFS